MSTIPSFIPWSRWSSRAWWCWQIMRFHAAAGDPPNLKICQRGQWNDRMLVETVLSMRTLVSHLKHVRHRCWDYLMARLAFLVTAVNLLLPWHGLPVDEQGF